MSVLVKGMEMPKNCACCDVACRYYLDHVLDGLLAKICHTESRLPDCPLIKVPESHGRLIDADALNYTMLYKENWMRGTGVEAPAIWRKDIDAAPTIIPAEESE